MIDVNRLNIDSGQTFFQSFFDADKFTSPNDLAYFPPPIYYMKNSTDEEHLTIIKDYDHNTEGVCIVALYGLNDLNSVINLNQGTKTTLRHLLLYQHKHLLINYFCKLNDNPQTNVSFAASIPQVQQR